MHERFSQTAARRREQRRTRIRDNPDSQTKLRSVEPVGDELAVPGQRRCPASRQSPILPGLPLRTGGDISQPRQLRE